MSALSAVRDLARHLPLARQMHPYGRNVLRADVIGALTLWALVVPQALAYAELAGLPASAGLYTAFFGMCVYALLGTARLLNIGPESTIAVIVAGALGPLAADDPDHYAALAGMLAILTAGFLFLGAIARAGFITRFLSAPVLTGYLCGAGIVIATSQLAKALGIKASGNYPTVVAGMIRDLDQTSWISVLVAGGTVATVLLLERFVPVLPAPLIALAAATIVTAAAHLDDRISTLGDITTAAPFTHLGDLRLHEINALIPTALSIAVFVYATSILTTRATDPDHADEVDPQREFTALGSANVATGLFGGFPANSSDSRSALLARSGARTQAANLVAGAGVLLTALFLLPAFRMLPNAALAGVILLSAIRLVDVAGLRRLHRLRTADFVLAAATAVGVLVTGPIGGIGIGVVVSLLDVIRRTLAPRTAILARVPGTRDAWRDAENYPEAAAVTGVLVYRFDAPLFFGNAQVFHDEILGLVDEGEGRVRAIVVNAEGVTDLDVTGADTVRKLLEVLRARDVHLIFARLRSNVRELADATGISDVLGPDSYHLRVESAVREAEARARRS
ncbi:SulP family inorganic anion transporter [Yinghuangia sp. YIM S09857]|uniref:SulP family inorganic anion transporter n=1 Tax=Yinghuangia sp. YIM S09857 TaxID=3436929 RepID=UPI003F52EB21